MEDEEDHDDHDHGGHDHSSAHAHEEEENSSHSFDDAPRATSFSSIVLRIPDLLAIASHTGTIDESMAVYVYDACELHNQDEGEMFLGAAIVHYDRQQERSHNHNEEFVEEDALHDPVTTPLPEVSYDDLVANAKKENLLFVEDALVIIANQRRKVVLVALADTYQTNYLSLIHI